MTDFERVLRSIEKLSNKISAMDERIEKLSGKVSTIEEKINKISKNSISLERDILNKTENVCELLVRIADRITKIRTDWYIRDKSLEEYLESLKFITAP